MPKPLVSVGGKKLIDHMLDRLAEAGVEEAIVNVHYKAAQIEAPSRDTRPEPRIAVSDETRPLCSIRPADCTRRFALLGDAPVFICNTDAIWLEGPVFESRHARLALEPRDHGYLADGRSGRVERWRRLARGFPDGDGRTSHQTPRARGRALRLYRRWHIEAVVVQEVPGGPVKLAPYFFAAAQKGRLFGQRLDGQWLHVGTPEAIGEADQRIQRSVY